MKKWQFFTIPPYQYVRFKKRDYADLVITLDTETTSYFFVNGEWVTDNGNQDVATATERRAVLYAWAVTIGGIAYKGRELKELREFLLKLSASFGGVNIIIYVHNLGFDFEFMSSLFDGWQVFARKAHKPIYVYLEQLAIEFRCSYFLTGMSLAKAAKSIGTTRKKAEGDLDYTLARTPKTPLTSKEWGYIEHDVLTLNDIIEHYRAKYKNVANIPLTQTGEVRRVVRREVLNDRNHLERMAEISRDFDIYKRLTRLFMGGVTHLNYLFNGEIVENVKSYDRRSSYPAVMCCEQFPLGKFEQYNGSINDNSNFYAYFGLLKIRNLRSKTAWDYISLSKCELVEKGVTDNGKVLSAEYVEIWVTDVDYQIIQETYSGEFEITNLYRAQKRYLPLPFVQFILKLYSDKTTLKNVTGREDDYAKSKQFINSLYGMTVTNNIRDEVVYKEKWKTIELTDETIAERLEQERPFLPFAVGVWVTAYARRELFSVVNKIGNQVVYVDTDSVKGIGELQPIIDDYNKELFAKIDKICELRKLDKSLFFPIAPDGTVCPLGEFAFEGEYEQFKSFGAKKYCYVENGEFHTVVAGCAKTWIDEHKQSHPVIPSIEQFSLRGVYPHGRRVHWYVYNQPATEVTDYLGNSYISPRGVNGVVIAESAYTMGLSNDYALFLQTELTTHNKYTSYTRMHL